MRAASMLALAIALAVDAPGCALIDAIGGDSPDALDPEGPNDGGDKDSGGNIDGGGGVDSGLQVEFESAQLWAVHPPIAHAGTVVRLEGEFTTTDDNKLYLAELGSEVTLGALGVGRATLEAPGVQYYTGAITARAAATDSYPATLRLTRFELGLTRIQNHYPQTNGARTMPVLDVPRYGHTTEVIERWVYAIGGDGDHTIARAEINADGTLTPFALYANNLLQPRFRHTSVRLGPWLYVIGGEHEANALGSVARAPVPSGAGDIGTFSDYEHSLIHPRSGAALAVVGSFVYVIGGAEDMVLSSIERAEILPTGDLGPFEVLAHTQLGTPRMLHSVHVIGDYLYAMGGREALGNALASVERAPIHPNGDLGSFEPGPNMDQTRAAHVSVVLGDQIYLLGGGDPEPKDSVETAGIDANGGWEDLTAAGFVLPDGRTEATGVVIGNELYLIGGMLEGENTATIARGSVLESGGLSSAINTESNFLYAPRRGHSVAATADWLFTFGGQASGVDHIGKVRAQPGGMLSLPFEPVGPWENPRSGACTAVLGEQIYLAGGALQGGAAQATVEGTSFSALLGTPFTASGSLSTARAETACVAVGGYLYVIGGEDSAVLDSVERAPYDSEGNLGTFAALGEVTLKTARKGHTVAVLGDYVYVIGGVGSGGGNLTSIERALIDAEGDVGDFAAAGDLPEARSGHASMSLGPRLYVFGGDDRLGFHVVNTDSDGALDLPFQGAPPSFTHYRHRSAAIAVGNFLYMLGGEKDASPSNEVLRLMFADD